MNCQDFENIVDELSRASLMDARTREAALAHADSCRRCDTRLADERAVRAGLRSLASAASGVEAPARIESALLAAFRAQAGASANENTSAPAAVVAAVNVTPLARRSTERRWTWVKTFATAATAAAAAAVLLMIIPPGMDAPTGDNIAEKSKTERTKVEPQAARMIEPAPNFVEKNEDTPAPTEVANVEPPRAFNSPRGGGRTTPVSYSTSANRRAPTSRRARPAEEVVTEFMPLGNADYSASVDAGQVVRVELPRSALASIGLPVSADRASERIKADVLVGEDGLARAIRFVR